MRVLTLVLQGFGLVAECALNIGLVFVIPIGAYLIIHPFIGYGTAGLLGGWSYLYVRAARRRGDERRAIAQAAEQSATMPAGPG